MGIGLLRVILALTVVITHTHSIFGFTLGNPVIAVRSFFVVSGFYMTLILNERYHQYRAFFVTRFLRIYPIYLAILVLTIGAGILAHLRSGHWGEMEDFVLRFHQMNWSTILALVIGNIAIFGRNTLMFLGLNSHGVLTYAKAGYETAVWPFLLIPQAWTLGLELSFYLLAPFLAKQRLWLLAVIAICSVALRTLLIRHGFDSILWTYRFFPTELIYFVFGIVSYHLYARLQPTMINKYFGLAAFYLAVLMLSTFNFWPSYVGYNLVQLEWAYYPILALLIPFIFIYSKDLQFDQKVGEYSYPVYLVHILILNTLGPVFLFRYASNNTLALWVFAFSLIASALLLRFVQRPADRWRSRLRKGQERIMLP